MLFMTKLNGGTYTNKTWHLNLLSVTSQIPQQLKLDEDNKGKLNLHIRKENGKERNLTQ